MDTTTPSVEQTSADHDAVGRASVSRVLDAFALSGILGLPAPAENLAALDDLRAKQSAEEAALMEDRLRLLKEESADIERIREGARHQLGALPAVLDALDVRESDLAKRELEALRRRASVSSSLASRRVAYPHRLATEKERLFSDFVNRITERERTISTALADDPQAKAAQERARLRESGRQEAAKSTRARIEAAADAVLQAEKRLRTLDALGLTRATSGFLTFTGLTALVIIGVVMGAQLTWLPGRPLDLISSGLAVVAAALTNPLRELGPPRAALALAGAWAVVTVLMWLTLWTGDVLLGRLNSHWSSSSSPSRDRLPGLWAGGEGRVVTRHTFHQRLARLPFLAAACVPALLTLLFVSWDARSLAAITAPTFWTVVTGGFLGLAVVAIMACAAVVWVAPRLAAIQEGEVSSRIRLWWPAWTGLAFSLAAVPVPGSVGLAPLTYLGQLGWLAGGSIAFAIGLVTSANHRTCNILKAQVRSAEGEIARILEYEDEHSRTRLELELTRAREAVDAQFDGALGNGTEGTLSFVRPTRRFFNTPQSDDDLDKATLEEYSAADAVFEPELLTQLFDVSAELQQLRAELVALRDKHKEVIAERSRLQDSLNEYGTRLRQLLDDRERLLRDYSRNEQGRALQCAEIHSSTASAVKMGDLFRTMTPVGGSHDVTA